MSRSEDFETWQRSRRAGFDPDIGDESPDGLYAHKIQSENREYSLYWADGHYWLTRGRQVRTEGPYPVFPTDNADARVANNGNFIISSASGKESYHIVFRAFTNEGVPIVERYFKSNRVNLGLSFDGKFAVCQTARGYDPDDSMLTMFDLELGTISWRRQSLASAGPQTTNLICRIVSFGSFTRVRRPVMRGKNILRNNQRMPIR